jgi:general secretion pathway protein G
MILQHRNPRRSDRLGFTLMEVLVVVAILVVLAGVSSVAVFSYLDNAKLDRAKVDTQNLADMCKAYKLKFGQFPESLNALWQPPSGKPFVETQDALMDPWQQQYQYAVQGTTVKVWTTPPDGSEAEISNQSNKNK